MLVLLRMGFQKEKIIQNVLRKINFENFEEFVFVYYFFFNVDNLELFSESFNCRNYRKVEMGELVVC